MTWDSSCSVGEKAVLGDGFRDGTLSTNTDEKRISHVAFSSLGRVTLSELGRRGSGGKKSIWDRGAGV